jgi:hypothetical protein
MAYWQLKRGHRPPCQNRSRRRRWARCGRSRTRTRRRKRDRPRSALSVALAWRGRGARWHRDPFGERVAALAALFEASSGPVTRACAKSCTEEALAQRRPRRPAPGAPSSRRAQAAHDDELSRGTRASRHSTARGFRSAGRPACAAANASRLWDARKARTPCCRLFALHGRAVRVNSRGRTAGVLSLSSHGGNALASQ